jgi:hypothetical protein
MSDAEIKAAAQSLCSPRTESPAAAQFGKSKSAQKYTFSHKRLETMICELIVSYHIDSCRRYSGTTALAPYPAGLPGPGCLLGKKDST